MSDNAPPKGPKNPPNVQIQVPEDIAQGTYANLTFVNHNETEFVLDFIFLQPLEPRAKVRSRIISSPKHAKRFLNALRDNIARYEDRFGEIDISRPGPAVH